MLLLAIWNSRKPFIHASMIHDFLPFRMALNSYKFCQNRTKDRPGHPSDDRAVLYSICLWRCWNQKFFWPLWYQIATCFALSQSSKTFVIRSFFFEKWLLTHVFGGSQGQKFSCKQACVELLTFWPWYHIIKDICIFADTPSLYWLTDYFLLVIVSWAVLPHDHGVILWIMIITPADSGFFKTVGFV